MEYFKSYHHLVTLKRIIIYFSCVLYSCMPRFRKKTSYSPRTNLSPTSARYLPSDLQPYLFASAASSQSLASRLHDAPPPKLPTTLSPAPRLGLSRSSQHTLQATNPLRLLSQLRSPGQGPHDQARGVNVDLRYITKRFSSRRVSFVFCMVDWKFGIGVSLVLDLISR
jgi:hypothetical protein